MSGSLATPDAVERLIGRLQRLTFDTPRRWGSMTPHEMLCHLADSFSSMMGERDISMVAATPFKRHLMRLLALRTPLPWPKGIPTRPEVDPKRTGTKPQAFEADRQHLIQLLRRFAADDARYAQHPMFGAMDRADWLRWAYRHTDHHLRQFGL